MKHVVFAVLLLSSFGAAADIFKCVIDGKNVYQTGPCPDPDKETALKMKRIDDMQNLRGEMAKRNFEIESAQKLLPDAQIARERALVDEAYSRSEARERQADAEAERAEALSRSVDAMEEESAARARFWDRKAGIIRMPRH